MSRVTLAGTSMRLRKVTERVATGGASPGGGGGADVPLTHGLTFAVASLETTAW